LSFNADIVRRLLSRYVIDKSKPEWRVKKLCWDGVEREIPDSLNGEILLEEHVEDGRVKGWITVAPEALAEILSMRDNPALRPDIVIEFGKYKGRNLRMLTRDEFEEATGYKKYFDRWRREGITI
jgi:hypothetical protein